MAYLYLLFLLTLVSYIGYILKDKHRPSWLFWLGMALFASAYGLDNEKK